MKYRTLFALLLVLAAAVPARAQQPSFREMFDRLLPAMGAAATADRKVAQQEFQNACFALGTPGRDAERAQACQVIVAKLGPATAKPARLWLLKQLQYIGKGECAAALAAALDESDPHIRDAARRALIDNPSPEATGQFEARLKAATDSDTRLAMIHALAYRASATSVAVIETYLPDSDVAVASAAADAMGRIATAEAAQILVKARANSNAVRQAIADAALRCADRLVSAGNCEQAAKIYFAYSVPEQPRPIRLAALRGRLVAAGPDAAALTLDMLGRDDPVARAVAAQHLAQLPAGAAARIAAGLAKLPGPSQLMLLGALRANGDKSTVSAALAAAKGDNPDLKAAAVAALAKLGGAAEVPLLVAEMLSGGPCATAGRESLQQVFGPGVEEAILAAVEQAEPKARKTLLEVVEARRMVSAVPLFFKYAEDKDADLRARSIRALGNLAEPKDAPAAIALLLKASKGRERDDAERAVMFICTRIEDPASQAGPVLEAMKASEADRLALYSVLGRIGGPKALETINAAIKSDNPEIQDAGVRALCNWPDDGVAGQLLQMAGTAANESHRLWALRAYVRVVTPRDNRGGDKKTLALFQKALDMAGRDEDRRYILSRAAAIRTPETVRWLLPHLDNPAVATDAARSIVDLAHRKELFEPNKAEFTKVLRKVIATCKDRGTVERAERILKGL